MGVDHSWNPHDPDDPGMVSEQGVEHRQLVDGRKALRLAALLDGSIGAQ